MAKNTTVWKPRSGYGDVTKVESTNRTLEQSTATRTTEGGATRTLESSNVKPKNQTVWSKA